MQTLSEATFKISIKIIIINQHTSLLDSSCLFTGEVSLPLLSRIFLCLTTFSKQTSCRVSKSLRLTVLTQQPTHFELTASILIIAKHIIKLLEWFSCGIYRHVRSVEETAVVVT